MDGTAISNKAAFMRRRDYIVALTARDAVASLADDPKTANPAALAELEDRLYAAKCELELNGEPVPADSETCFTPPPDSAAGLAASIVAAAS